MPMLTTIEELEAIYGQPHERAVRNEIADVKFRAWARVCA
jgi:hypothetical protein